MQRYSIYDFQGIYRDNGRETSVMKMSLEECINECFFIPAHRWCTGRRNMKEFFDCRFAYGIALLGIADIIDLVEKGYVFIPFSKTVDKDDVLNYIKLGLKPLFMKAGEFNTMKRAYALHV